MGKPAARRVDPDLALYANSIANCLEGIALYSYERTNAIAVMRRAKNNEYFIDWFRHARNRLHIRVIRCNARRARGFCQTERNHARLSARPLGQDSLYLIASQWTRSREAQPGVSVWEPRRRIPLLERSECGAGPAGVDAQCQFRRQRGSLSRGQHEDLRQDGRRGWWA